MTVTNPLARGLDVYADAAAAAVLLAPRVQVNIDATKWNAGTSSWVASPVKGRVRQLILTVNVANSANASDVTLKNGSDVLCSAVVESAATAGTTYIISIPDGTTGADVIEGEALEVTCDGDPSAGEVNATVVVEPYNA